MASLAIRTARSLSSGGLAILVDVEKMGAVAVPLRRTTDGALAPDWGRIPARVYAAGLAGHGRRTMTACLEAIADWLSGGRRRHRHLSLGQPALQPTRRRCERPSVGP